MEDLVNSTANPWKGRRVFLTGHTGFKGGWLALWLAKSGATIRGYALAPSTEPNVFTSAKIGNAIEDVRGDILDASSLQTAITEFRPEVVFHLAAQPLVRRSYADPLGTYATNVMGTAHVLEAVRKTPSVCAVVCVTTDKCYENRESHRPYRESDPLGGHDPYSSSKACAEIVSAAYRNSFFSVERPGEHRVALATARAGNVIGGGDWAKDRLMTDLIAALTAGRPAIIRNPLAVRPWQHVLEPVRGYLMLAEQLWHRAPEVAEGWNFGPNEDSIRPVGWIADWLVAHWGQGARWELDQGANPHEARHLKLDCSKAKAGLGWEPAWSLERALEQVASWTEALGRGDDMRAVCLRQISDYVDDLR